MKKILLFLSLICLPFSMITNVEAASNASDTLKTKVATEGDGLYIDKYNEGRYVYKGGNPNNFVKFNNELWRIISLEKDGTLKIIKNDILDNKLQFNDKNSNGSYCNSYYNGPCNAWGKSEFFDGGSAMVVTQSHPVNGTVTEDSLINKYLNNDFYNLLSDKDKCKVTAKNYYFGRIVNRNDDIISDIIKDERTQIWNGNIALPNVSDLLLASNDESNCSDINKIHKNYNCYYINPDGEKVICPPVKMPDDWKQYADNNCSKDNYLMISGLYDFGTDNNKNYLFINAANLGFVYEANSQGLIGYQSNDSGYPLYNVSNKEKGIRPVTYLRSDMKITNGDGSENNPYIIESETCNLKNNNSNFVVDVPSTSMFISIFIIGGFILIVAICIVIYLKVFKRKDVK